MTKKLLMTVLALLMVTVSATTVAEASTATVGTPGAVSQAAPQPPQLPPGYTAFGPFDTLADCVEEGLATITPVPTLDWTCSYANGAWWLIVWVKNGNAFVGYLTALGNQDEVSAELNYTGGDAGLLRARATSVGPWERFTVVAFGDNVIALRASNGLWVSAELNYPGNTNAMLRARATSVGPWEKFTIVPDGGNAVALKAANGKLVSAELGYSGAYAGLLRARATSAGPWERFTLLPLAG